MDTDQAEESKLLEKELTEKILAAAFKVHNTLGPGFLEKVYENALATELRKLAVPIDQQFPFVVRYDGTVVGEYVADLVVEKRVLVECKAVAQLDPVHEAQLLNYLRASGVRVGLLLNFGRTRLLYRRLVL